LSDSIWESEKDEDLPDPDETSPESREVITQHYDLVVNSLMDQIRSDDIVLRPSFQRGYVWSNPMASRLLESILLNVPIPACYLSQNDDFILDVVDGQQRLNSIFRYVDNQFALSSLNVAKELNGKRFHQLPTKLQRQIRTHTIRCTLITNKSHPDIKFDIFERLNTNTASLNSQELRNCLYRGPLNDLLRVIAERKNWLETLGRKIPDKRMRGEEIALRFFAFSEMGLSTYRTPLKNWLNDAAKAGQSYSPEKISQLDQKWENMLTVATTWFEPNECFRRSTSKSLNKALFDLLAQTACNIDPDDAEALRPKVRDTFNAVLKDKEFDDLISRAVDHKKRAIRRFEIWNNHFDWME